MTGANRNRDHCTLSRGTLCRFLSTLLWLACAALFAHPASAQSQMQIIAGAAVGAEGVSCPAPGEGVCTGTSTLGYRSIGCRTLPFSLPASPIPICNSGYGGDGGPAIWAMLTLPMAVAADKNGNVYVADSGNLVVRKIDSSGNISTAACIDPNTNAVVYTGCQLPGTNSPFYLDAAGWPVAGSYISAVAVDGNGNLYVGVASAGTGQGGTIAMTSDPNGNVYALNIGSGEGFDVTITMNGNALFSTQNGTLPIDATFAGLAADAAGNVYTVGTSGTYTGKLIELTPGGGISVVLNEEGQTLLSNMAANGLAMDTNGNFYFLVNSAYNTQGSALVEEYNPTTQTFTVLAGTGTDGFNDGNFPADGENLLNDFTNVNGPTADIDLPMPATATDLNNATGIAIGPGGVLYIADTGNDVVRKIGGNPAGIGCNECGPTTLAITDPIATNNFTSSWALNPSTHKLYVVYPFTATGTVAANVVTAFSTTNDTVVANIPVGNQPGPIAVDSTNNLIYVGNTRDNTVSVINSLTDQVLATIPVAGSPFAIAVDPALNKAYVSISNGTSVSVISGPTGGNPPAFLYNISVFVPSALAVDTIRHFVYVRYFGPANLGEQNYSLAIINSTTDQIVNTVSIGIQLYESNIYPDSMAVDESTGNVLIGDDYDQYAHLWEYSSQTLSGFFGAYGGFYNYHVAVDSINAIFYTWDGYGNAGYLVPNVTSGVITSTSSLTNSSASYVAVDPTTEQAYVVNCSNPNSDGSLGTVTLWDSYTDKILTTQSLEIPSTATSEGCGGILVDSSNSNPLLHSAWVGLYYNSSASGQIGQIDAINGATPAPRPALTVSPNPISFGAAGVGQNSESVILAVTNSGTAPLTSLTPLMVNPQDPNSIQFINGCSLPLAVGSTCDFFLTFTPSQIESLTASLLFLDNSPNTPQAVTLTGSGIPPTGPLTISPLSLPLGVVGSSYSQSLTASGGSGSTLIFSLSNGSLPSGLTLYPAGQLNGTPTQANTYTFTVSVLDTGTGKTGSQLYSLTILSVGSTSTTAYVFGSASSGTLSFGNIEVNEPSGTQQFTIENSGSVNLQISAITLTGPNVKDFTESDNCSSQSWPPYQSCTVNVSFLPSLAPTANELAELVISSNASLPTILLTGTSAPPLGAPTLLPALVSVDNGNPPNPAAEGYSSSVAGPGLAALSSGGQFIAFSVGATNLPGPLPSSSGSSLASVYLRNECVGTASGCEESTTYISYGPATGPASNGGAACNNSSLGGYSGSKYPAIDTTGEFVAFTSDTCGFTGSTSANANQIFLRDVLHGTASLISVDSSGQPFASGADRASFSMSANAQFFAFQTTSANVVSGVTNPNATDEVYWSNVCTGQSSGCTPSTLLISQDGNGNPGNNTSEQPSLSANGRYLAYASHATNLASTPANNNTTGLEQIYLFDTCTGAPKGCTPLSTLISLDANGNAVGGTNPSVSADGRFVAFVSSAPTLISTTNPPSFIDQQVFLHDTCYSNGVQVSGCTAPSTTLLSQSNGTPGNGYSSSPFISADGRLITFTSQSSNLNSSDSFTNVVYEYDSCQANEAPVAAPCTPGLFPLSVNSEGALFTQGSDGAIVDATDQYVTFASNVASNSGYPAAQIYLASATPAAPIATFNVLLSLATTPNAISFGSYPLGEPGYYNLCPPAANNGLCTSPLGGGSLSVSANVVAFLTLTNTGSAPLNLALLSLVDQSAPALTSAPFVLSALSCNTIPGGQYSTVEQVSAFPNLTLAPGIGCLLSVEFQPTAPGTYNGTLSFADNAAQSNVATQPIVAGVSYAQTIPISGTVTGTPTVSIAAPSTASIGQTFSYSIIISNPTGLPANNLIFSDSLPPGLTLVSVIPQSFTCNSASPIACTGSLAAGGSETLAVTVLAGAVGPESDTANLILTNTYPGFTVPSPSASVTTTVSNPSVPVSMTFTPNNIPVGGTTLLTITLSNPYSFPLTGVTIGDGINGGLTLSGVPTDTCGGTMLTYGVTFTLSGATLAPSSTCAISAYVIGNIAGPYSNSTSALSFYSGSIQVNGGTATASFVVSTSQLVVVPSGVTYRRTAPSGYQASVQLTLKNTGPTAVAGPFQIVFTNLLPAGATLNGATGTFNGNPFLTLNSPSLLPAGQSIVVPVTFQTPTPGITFTPVVYAGTL